MFENQLRAYYGFGERWFTCVFCYEGIEKNMEAILYMGNTLRGKLEALFFGV